MTRLRGWLLAGLAGLVLGPAVRADISIQFDYTYDGGFFTSHAEAKTTLEYAADALAVFTDDLDAIVPGGLNTWEATITRPDDGEGMSVQNLVVPADTLIVYAGGRDLGGSLGVGGPGGWSVSGVGGAWFDTVEARGEIGYFDSPATDFGPWGGQVTFTTAGDTDWYFGVDPAGLGGGQSDFLSVAMHELGHLLGIGTADSWETHVSGGVFTGPAAVAEHGGNVSLYPDLSHWASGTESHVDGAAQEAAMDPSLTQGTRKVFTALDFAGLADVGWEMPADERVWQGDVGPTWSATSNWSAGGPPDAGTTAAFDGATFYQPAVGPGAAVWRVEFRSAGWIVAGPGTLTVHGGGGGSLAAGTNTVAAPVAMADDATWTVAAGGTLALAGGLDAGGFTLVKDGEGLLVISGEQDHAEGSWLDIVGGTVEMGTDASGTGRMEDANLSIAVTNATLNVACNQHLDTLEIGEGGLVSFTGAEVVVVRRLIMNGMNLGATTLTPEPATLGLLVLGAGVLLARRYNAN
ncbi:MAG: PEP-CTERM sorting domain-containing protein [Phycisphaerae bacterium]